MFAPQLVIQFYCYFSNLDAHSITFWFSVALHWNSKVTTVFQRFYYSHSFKTNTFLMRRWTATRTMNSVVVCVRNIVVTEVSKIVWHTFKRITDSQAPVDHSLVSRQGQPCSGTWSPLPAILLLFFPSTLHSFIYYPPIISSSKSSITEVKELVISLIWKIDAKFLRTDNKPLRVRVFFFL